jgi:hypothetical protein
MLRTMAHTELPPKSELYTLATILARRFIRRWDCHARQLEDGRYVCVHQPLTPSLLVSHLAGSGPVYRP